MICVKCKKEIPDDAAFCQFCGRRQARETRKTAKRANGAGSVYKNSGKRKKPWVLSMDGVYVGSFETRTAAFDELERLRRNGIPADRVNMTFSQVYEKWSAEHFRSVGDNGKTSYENAYKNHCKELHDKKMRELRTEDFQACVDALDQAGKSRSTMEKLQQLFGQMSRWAMREQVTSTDFAQFVRLPEKDKAEKETFSEDDIEKLEGSVNDETAKIILILIYTGMRIGELFSVPKSDVYPDEGYMVGGEKTAAGRNRIIAFPDKILKHVKYFYGKAPNGGNLLDGSSVDKAPANFRKRQYYPLLDKLGIRRLNPHCTRHTFITKAIVQGVKMDDLLRIVGHVDKSTTQLYLHDNASTIRNMIKNIN